MDAGQVAVAAVPPAKDDPAAQRRLERDQDVEPVEQERPAPQVGLGGAMAEPARRDASPQAQRRTAIRCRSVSA